MSPISRHHYEMSQILDKFCAENNVPYYSIIQLAMRRGDTDNIARLRMCWPDVWADLQARYNAPGGVLPGDPPYHGPGETNRDRAEFEQREEEDAG